MLQQKTRFSSVRSRMFASVVAAAVLTTLAMAGACGGGGGSSGSSNGEECAVDDATQCFDYACFGDGASPAVSFKTDVLPFFRNSCGVGGNVCHGAEAGAPGQPFLGLAKDAGEMTQAQIDAIFMANVNKESVKAPGMMVVAPNDPKMSFLLHKIDHTLECADVTCTGQACGSKMPLGAQQPLEQADRDKVRLWIAQGAKND